MHSTVPSRKTRRRHRIGGRAPPASPCRRRPGCLTPVSGWKVEDYPEGLGSGPAPARDPGPPEHGNGTSDPQATPRFPTGLCVPIPGSPAPPLRDPRTDRACVMYLVELRPGKEELYRTGDELAAAIRSGEVDGHSRIYHRSSSKWISITLHPQYKAIVSLRAAHQTEGSDWMLAPQAETLEGATEPPGRLDDIVSDSAAAGGPEDDQGDNPWRRPIALGISGLFLLFGIQLAYSGPRPQWSTARANESEIPAAATVEQATSQQVVSLASTSTGWDEEPVVEEKVEPARPRPRAQGTGGAPQGAPGGDEVPRGIARFQCERSRFQDGRRAARRLRQGLRELAESPRLRHAGGPAEPAVRDLASHSGWWRHRHPARPRGRDQLHPCVSGTGGLDRADVPGFVHRDVQGPRLVAEGGEAVVLSRRGQGVVGAGFADRPAARQDRQRTRGAERSRPAPTSW